MEITTDFGVITFHYPAHQRRTRTPEPQKIPRTIRVPPRTEAAIELVTNRRTGTWLCPKMNIGTILFPEAIVSVNNYCFTTTVVNTGSEATEFTYHYIALDPFIETELVDINHIQIADKKKYNKLLNENLRTLRLDYLNDEEKTLLTGLCHDYKEIFHHKDIPLTSTNILQHKIRTKTEEPIFSKTYRYPQIHREEVQKQITKMLKEDIITPSDSPYNAPIWIVPKKMDASGEKKWRIVIDYRRVNEVTIEDKHPLPNIETILDSLGRCKYFTSLDLTSRFHQITIEEKDQEKTAFSTEEGHFHFKRMPFGLKNAPATFQRLMYIILSGLTPRKCLVYLDDIVIFSASLQEHINQLKEVFERLKEADVKVQLDKNKFLRKELNYLGHIITPDGIKPNPLKIECIRKFPIARTNKGIKSFLGLLGYYRKFIKDFY